jgi:hypothetical protein
MGPALDSANRGAYSPTPTENTGFLMTDTGALSSIIANQATICFAKFIWLKFDFPFAFGLILWVVREMGLLSMIYLRFIISYLITWKVRCGSSILGEERRGKFS